MKQPWTKEELSEIWKEVMVESDRGCVLLCAAHLDRDLEHLLRMKFHSISKVSDDDIDEVLTAYPAGALLGFAPRARVAHLLGLIPRDASVALRKFAKIRNVYAHNDRVPPLTEMTMQPVFDVRENQHRVAIKGIVQGFIEIQNIAESTKFSKGRIALMIATAFLGMELKACRERVATQAGRSPKKIAKRPKQPKKPKV